MSSSHRDSDRVQSHLKLIQHVIKELLDRTTMPSLVIERKLDRMESVIAEIYDPDRDELYKKWKNRLSYLWEKFCDKLEEQSNDRQEVNQNGSNSSSDDRQERIQTKNNSSLLNYYDNRDVMPNNSSSITQYHKAAYDNGHAIPRVPMLYSYYTKQLNSFRQRFTKASKIRDMEDLTSIEELCVLTKETYAFLKDNVLLGDCALHNEFITLGTSKITERMNKQYARIGKKSLKVLSEYLDSKITHVMISKTRHSVFKEDNKSVSDLAPVRKRICEDSSPSAKRPSTSRTVNMNSAPIFSSLTNALIDQIPKRPDFKKADSIIWKNQINQWLDTPVPSFDKTSTRTVIAPTLAAPASVSSLLNVPKIINDIVIKTED